MTGPVDLSPAHIVLLGLDAVEVALAGQDLEEKVTNARSLLTGLDAETLLRVSGWFASELAKAVGKAYGDKVPSFLERYRLEAVAELPVAPGRDGGGPVYVGVAEEMRAATVRMLEAERREARREAQAHLDAVALLAEAASELRFEDVGPALRTRLAGLATRDMRRLVLALCVEAVWALPPGASSMSEEERRGRFRVLRRWCQRRMREAGVGS